jgi:hypothetical protein
MVCLLARSSEMGGADERPVGMACAVVSAVPGGAGGAMSTLAVSGYEAG